VTRPSAVLLILAVVCLCCRFIFKDQYIEFSTRLPRDSNIYGIGEVSLPTGLQLPRDGTTITLWARDMPSANPYANLYGSHPFYLQLNAGGLRGHPLYQTSVS
jgi:alpha-glucosidase (family GH31 glycosyl hydrolase)